MVWDTVCRLRYRPAGHMDKDVSFWDMDRRFYGHGSFLRGEGSTGLKDSDCPSGIGVDIA